MSRRGGAEFLELRLVPVGTTGTARRLLLLEGLAGLEETGVLRVLGDLVELLLPLEDADIILVRQDEHVSLGRRTARLPARPKIWWAELGSMSFIFPGGPLTSDGITTDLAGRLIPAASVSVQTQIDSNFR